MVVADKCKYYWGNCTTDAQHKSRKRFEIIVQFFAEVLYFVYLCSHEKEKGKVCRFAA
jgi:hypothetical protein